MRACVCVCVCVCVCTEWRLGHVNIQFQGFEVSCHIQEHPVILQHTMFSFLFNLRGLITLIFDNMKAFYKYSM